MRVYFLPFLMFGLLISCREARPLKRIIPLDCSKFLLQTYTTGSAPKRVRKKHDSIFFVRNYKQLSNQFNLTVSISETDDIFITSHIQVSLYSKADSLVQIISVNAEVVGPIRDVSHVRSYETHFNENRKLEEPEFHGEIVVGDFNFDSLSDIAIVDMVPMSGTPVYRYYLQKENLHFELDSFLTNQVGNLPQKLNLSKKSFMAYYHTGCCAQTYRYFKFDEKGKCRLTFTKEIDLYSNN